MERSDALRELTIDAKWETNLEKQKRSIERIESYGSPAIPSLEEIMTVTTRDEIRKFCLDAIKGIQQKNPATDEQIRNNGNNDSSGVKKIKRRDGTVASAKSPKRKLPKRRSTRPPT
jgi:hypothetical protein